MSEIVCVRGGSCIRRFGGGCSFVIRKEFNQSDFTHTVQVTELGAVYSVLYCELMAWFDDQGIVYGVTGEQQATTFHFATARDAIAFKMRWL